MLKSASRVLILINPSPSNIKTLECVISFSRALLWSYYPRRLDLWSPVSKIRQQNSPLLNLVVLDLKVWILEKRRHIQSHLLIISSDDKLTNIKYAWMLSCKRHVAREVFDSSYSIYFSFAVRTSLTCRIVQALHAPSK